MGKPAKSTRKFIKKQLGSALAVRRKLKPMKNALRRKQVAAEGKRLERSSESIAEGAGDVKAKKVEDLDVDELLRGDFIETSSDDEAELNEEDVNDVDLPPEKGDNDDFVDITPNSAEEESSEDEEEEGNLGAQNKKLRSEANKHKKDLEKLKQKDPEFYKFLQEHDNELLEFEDDEAEGMSGEDDDQVAEDEDQVAADAGGKAVEKQADEQVVLSTALVDAWSKAIKEKQHMGAVRNMLRAFRSACHYGDGEDEDLASTFNVASSHVFNKIMLFVLSEMDGVFKKTLGYEDVTEKKSGRHMAALDYQKNSKWKKVEPLLKSYLGNAHHILKQMSDNQMIGFTLRRIKVSVPFLAAFPKLARLYLKAALHFWGTSEGALPVISLLFIREMAMQLGTDYLDACLKGIYKEYAANSRFVNSTRLPQIRFMANCVVELYGLDLAASYQHAFVFIRQLAILLRKAFTMKTKDSFKSVYRWQYMNCLEVWVNILCTYSDKEDLRPLVYPVAQIITGVARLVPTVRYFPLRLQCVKLLNRLAASTGSYIPVSTLLMDILQFKELYVPPTGGAGNAFDFSLALKVPKPMLKTRGFHEECVFRVVDQLVEHLAQWSCAIAFPELAVVPVIHLKKFLKGTSVDRFRRHIKQLIEQIDRNVEFVKRQREKVTISPKDIPGVTAFLQDEKKSGASPLLQYAAQLRQRAADREKNLQTSSMVVGDTAPATEDAEDGDDEALDVGEEVFSKDWLPQKKSSDGEVAMSSKPSSSPAQDEDDIVEDLLLSSEDEMGGSDSDTQDQAASEEDEDRQRTKIKSQAKRQKSSRPGFKQNGSAKSPRPGFKQNGSAKSPRPAFKQKGSDKSPRPAFKHKGSAKSPRPAFNQNGRNKHVITGPAENRRDGKNDGKRKRADRKAGESGFGKGGGSNGKAGRGTGGDKPLKKRSKGHRGGRAS